MDDPLVNLRLLADADRAIWARHLDVSRLTNKPQMLALSGGGEDGAFGAGALCGWSQTGDRPDFDIVTGVSTGALIAPMAFVGAAYDDRLRDMFLAHNADDIMRFRWLSAPTSDGLYDTTPLANLIAANTPDAFLEQVAQKHDAGGRLFVVTANLSTSKAVVWNMGALAKARQYELFRSVIRASGALPGMFSPVRLGYVSDGTRVTETHVDGGIQMQALTAPKAAFGLLPRSVRGGHGYVIVNNTLEPDPVESASSVLGVSQQALTAMVRSNAAQEVKTTRLLAEKLGLGFSYASVDADSGVVYDPSNRFSPDYMAALFDHGYQRAVTGSLWQA